MRYACPGSTFIEPSQSSHAPIKPAKRINFNNANDKDKGKGKLKPAQRTAKKEQIAEAKKKAHLRQKAARFTINYVFVGNLEPTITRKDLYKHFERCGRVTKVEIRCSRGQAINVGIPNATVSPRDRKYATVEFEDPSSVKNALDYHGSVIGRYQTRIVVCPSPADLPEVVEMVTYQIKKMEEAATTVPATLPQPIPRQFGPRPLGPKVTELFTDYTRPENDRIRFMGFSFAKTIL